jgi:hypothetical protein
MSFDPDDLYSVEAGLLQACHAELATTSAGAPARSCIYPGLEVAWDDCDCDTGLLAVSLRSITPHFKESPGPLPFVNCSAHVWLIELAITVARCAPETADDRPPPCDAVERAARTQIEDLAAVARAVQCTLAGRMFRLATQMTAGPMGLCVGAETAVSLGLGNCRVHCPEPGGEVSDG